MGADGDSGARPSGVVGRALAVLEMLSDFRGGLSLQELHERLGIPVGSMHRLLGTLHDEGFVSRSPRTRRYVLGPKALKLGARPAGYDSRLVSPPPPLLVAQEVTTETVSLSQLVDDRVICVALSESSHPLRLFVRLGEELPMHAAASARVVLAFQPAAVIDRLVAGMPFPRFTHRTIQDAAELRDHLAEVRRCGYDICIDELDAGVWAVAAPVYDGTGSVFASVTVSGAVVRMTAERRRVAIRAALDAAAAISLAQGHVDDEAGRELIESPMDPVLAELAIDHSHRPRT